MKRHLRYFYAWLCFLVMLRGPRCLWDRRPTGWTWLGLHCFANAGFYVYYEECHK